MDIGITTAFSHHTPIDRIVGTAQRIDAAGFATMWVPEHVLFFPEYESSYPYSKDGKLPGNPDGVLDPFTALTFVAAHTSTVRLGTGICLVPQRQPIYTAKMVADLDYLSGGRVDFGIGVGWLEEEFDALDIPFAARGRLTSEYIAAMKALWGADPVNFEGDTVTIRNAQFNPKPVQAPHPPIFVGGESNPAMRRVATLADGWYAFGVDPFGIGEQLDRLDAHLHDADRTRSDVKIYVSPGRGGLDRDGIRALADAGVDQVILPLFARDLDGIDRRIDAIRTLTGLE